MVYQSPDIIGAPCTVVYQSPDIIGAPCTVVYQSPHIIGAPCTLIISELSTMIYEKLQRLEKSSLLSINFYPVNILV